MKIELRGLPVLGEGFKHVTYRLGEHVYKVVKDHFLAVDDRTEYETECAALRLMGQHGFPVPADLRILTPAENDMERYCLQESYLPGAQYKDGVIDTRHQQAILACILDIARIRGDHYGDIRQGHATWHGYLNHVLDTYREVYANSSQIPGFLSLLREGIKKYVPEAPTPCLNIMDTNVMNFFFDPEGNICGIIDVDHPVFSDIDFVRTMIKWHRDDWFNRDDWYALWVKDRFPIPEPVRTIYEFVLAYDDVCMRHVANRQRLGSTDKMLKLEAALASML